MRTLRLPLALVALLALVAPSRAEFDNAGIAPAKANATQATGAAFGDGMATNRPAQQTLNRFRNLPIAPRILKLDGFIYTVNLGNYTSPPAKNPSNVPRPKR